MRSRSVLIVHEELDASAHLPADVVAVAATLRARGLDVVFAHATALGDRADRMRSPTPDVQHARPGASVVGDGDCDGERRLRDALARSQALEDIVIADFAAGVICDHGRMLERLAHDPALAASVRALDATQRPIAAVGRAPVALASIGAPGDDAFLRGRRITYASDPWEWTDSTTTLENDGGPDSQTFAARVAAAGATVRFEAIGAEHVCVDSYLITAQNRRSAASAARTISHYVEPHARSRRLAS